MSRRWYVPAYQASNGNIIPCGQRTVSQEYAEKEADEIRSPEDEAEVFVAFRDEPDWMRVAPPVKAACRGFAWVGQSFKYCEDCGQPYWEHTHDKQVNREKGPFDEGPWLYVPITDEQKASVRAKWGSA